MSKLSSRGPGRPPKSDGIDTHARIVAAARAVFSEVGYAATTFQAVALRADLTRPAINHYFASKRELYRQVAGETLDYAFRSGLDSARDQKSLTERLAAFAAGAHSSGPSIAAFLVTIQHEARRNEDLAEEGRKYSEMAHLVVKWALDEAIKNGEVEGVSTSAIDSATEALLVMLSGFHFYVGYMGSGPLLDRNMRLTT